MVKDFEITCPYCSKTFSGEDLYKDHLAEADKKFKEKEQAILLNAKKNAEAEANKKIKNNEIKMSSLLEANKLLKQKELDNTKKFKEKEKEITDKAIKKAEAEANKKFKDSEKKMSSLQEANKILKDKAAESTKKAKEREAQIISEANKKAEEAAKTMIKQKEKKLETDAIKKAKDEVSRDLKEQKIQLDKKNKEIEIIKRKAQKDVEEIRKGNDKKLRNLEKRMQQEASERKGENQEQIIEDFLRQNFPLDKIIPIKKGARGADCIQQINHKDRTKISQIYYESKDTKEYSELWVDKLLGDMADKDINFGIIVTETMPKSNNGKIEFRHNNRIAICPMDWELLWTQANAFREQAILFNQFKGKNTPDNLGKDELWETFKTGSNYKLITEMSKQHLKDVKDFDTHERSLNKLKINIQNRRRVFLEFIANLKNIPDLYPDDFLDED